MEAEELREQLDKAELVLVGLGEEFDAACRLQSVQEFQRGREFLQGKGALWLLPAWSEYCAERKEMSVESLLGKLKSLLEGRNYFVVSVSTNSAISSGLGGEKKLVMPCGGVLDKQCEKCCEGALSSVTERDFGVLEEFFEQLWSGRFTWEKTPELGRCGHCGGPMILNNIYAGSYDERGYHEAWNVYTKWLQGTLNRRLLLLELGVSMGFPSVVRLPFEKITRYNQKAFLYRVNEKLYQLPEDILSKGYGISKNAIDWLGQL